MREARRAPADVIRVARAVGDRSAPVGETGSPRCWRRYRQAAASDRSVSRRRSSSYRAARWRSQQVCVAERSSNGSRSERTSRRPSASHHAHTTIMRGGRVARWVPAGNCHSVRYLRALALRRIREKSGSSCKTYRLREADERVAHRRQLAADLGVPAPLCVAAIRAVVRRSVHSLAPLTDPAVEDDTHIRLLAEFPVEIRKEVRLLARNDEEVLTHRVRSIPLAEARQRKASRRSTRVASRASREGRRCGPRRGGWSSSSS